MCIRDRDGLDVSILQNVLLHPVLGIEDPKTEDVYKRQHEVGFDFDISFANPISEKTPNLCHLAPAGPTYMEDLNEAGGVYAVSYTHLDVHKRQLLLY